MSDGKIPAPPRQEIGWLINQVEKGVVPKDEAHPAAGGRASVPPGPPDVIAPPPMPVIKEKRKRGRPKMDDRERTMKKALKVDETLSEDDWKTVLKAFAKTGNVGQIAEVSGLTAPKVQHLLDFGLIRLGLKPIREAATDFEEVAKRTEKLVGPIQQAIAETPGESGLDLKQAVTERAVRETVAAQSTLLAAVKASDIFLGYVNKLFERMTAEDGGFLIPDKITGGQLEQLGKIAASLANATDRAIQQSRLTAGEPTQNIALQVASFVVELSPEELRRYVTTKELPQRLRAGGGGGTAAALSDGNAPKKMIDVKSE